MTYARKLERLLRYTATMKHIIRRAHAHAQLMDELAADLASEPTTNTLLQETGSTDALQLLERIINAHEEADATRTEARDNPDRRPMGQADALPPRQPTKAG